MLIESVTGGVGWRGGSRNGKIKTGIMMRSEERGKKPARGRDARRNGEREEGEEEEAGRRRAAGQGDQGRRQAVPDTHAERAVSSVGSGGSGWQNVCVALVPGSRRRDETRLQGP